MGIDTLKAADQHTHLGPTYVPSSVEQIVETVLSAGCGINNVWMWRGQADFNWLIHSSAYRRVALSRSIPPSERDIASYEKYLIERAKHRGFHFVKGRELSDMELLARLQHHGAATRFVDMTRSVLVGLFFASNELPDKNGALIGIHTHHLGGSEVRLPDADYEKHILSIQDRKHPQTWQPPEVSPRIAAQHSQFVYSAAVQAPHGSVALEVHKKCLISFRISPDLKAQALDVLRGTFDISYGTLFPDIDGFGNLHGPNRDRWIAERW